MASYSGSNNYGRQTVYINIDEKELLKLDDNKLKKVLAEYIPVIVDIHSQNKTKTRNLWDYYLGIQDIKDKVKHTRAEINNKPVENWAYALVDFKKAWQLGNPIQYVMINSSSSKEIEILNRYARNADKESKDQWIYEDVLVVGRGFRYQNFIEKEYRDDENDVPFELYNLDRDSCEVVYEAGIEHRQLFSVVFTDMEKIVKSAGEEKRITYPQLTIYTRTKQLVCDFIDNKVVWKKETTPIIVRDHVITEYYVNRDRISMIELGKDLFDGINKLEALDFDDMEQFVNAIMVFTNAEVNEQDLEEIKALGAVNIKSTENKKASVELLTARLNAADTQVFYTRLITALHQILGIPMATDTGSVTSGDTGKAKMTGQGYTSAGIRAKTDETMFKKCDFTSLKTILRICKSDSKSKIKNLKAGEVDSKMNRDMSDNLLVKTQGLMNLLSAKIPKEYALPIVNLFSDANAVVEEMDKQEAIEEEKMQEMNAKEASDKTNAQDNKLTNANELDEQGQ